MKKPCIGKPYFFENGKYFAKTDIIVEKGSHFDNVPHTHDFIEFVYTYKGKITHSIDNVEYPTTKGDLIIINFNQVHNYGGSSDSQYYNFLVKPEYINESIASNKDFFALLDLKDYKDLKNLIKKENNLIQFSPEERRSFEHILILLDDEIEAKKIGYEALIYSGMTILITMILRKMSISYTNAENNLKEVLLYIKEHFSESISENKLAEMCHYNPSYFSRMFKDHTGMTFTSYLKNVRIRAACSMLQNTDIKINDLYSKVGYTDKTKFHRHFRQITGSTPLAYRKSKK